MDSSIGFRKSLLFYLKTNANPRLLFKLMQALKYFCYKDFPFFDIEEIHYRGQQWSYRQYNSYTDKLQKFNIDQIPKNLWITDAIYIISKETTIASKLISRIAVCKIFYLFLENQKISVDELKFLLNDKLTTVHLNEVTVWDLNGKPLLIENVLQQLIDVHCFLYNFRDDFSSQFDSDSTKNMIKVFKKSKIQRVNLFNVPELCDFNKFFKYMKENPQINFYLSFRNGLSDSYKQMLQDFTDEMKNYDFIRCPINFCFTGQIFKPTKFSGFGRFY